MTDLVDLQADRLLIKTQRPDRLLFLGQKRWSKADEAFVSPATLRNIRIVADCFPEGTWTDAARAFRQQAEAVDMLREKNSQLTRERDQIDISEVQGWTWGEYEPRLHQLQALALSDPLPEYGYFMDQGTGKTLVAINRMAQRWRQNCIKLVVVICPNSVKTNWRHPEMGGECELSKHRPKDVPFVTHVWMNQPNRDNRLQHAVFEKSLVADKPALHWLVVNVEALSVQRCQDYLHDLLEKYPAGLIIDESTRIKTPGVARTKVALSLGRYAVDRVIMSGTPVIKAPENAWSQLRFLGADVMPYDSVTAFRKHFVEEVRPFGYKGPAQVTGYKHIEQLSHLIDRVSFRVLKDECLDLPPKVYHKREVDMTPEQEKAYEDMRKHSYVLLEKHGMEVAAPIILVQMLRLQQISCGFLPKIDPTTGKLVEVVPLGGADQNPKIKAALNIIEEMEGKLIVWCAFTAQLKLMQQALHKEKIRFVSFYGEVSEEDRVTARERFQNDPDTKVFLGNPEAGGIGLTLTAAEAAIYLSNNFKTEVRVQSEDRCHRIGSDQHHVINYYDVVTAGSIDERVMDVLRSNKRLSDEIMRTGWREWI